MDGFTHNFELVFNEGQTHLKGKIEFNTDNKASFKLIDNSQPMTEEIMNVFLKWVADMRILYKDQKGIKKIKLVEIGVDGEK